MISYETMKTGESAYYSLQNRQDNHCWRQAISHFDTSCASFSNQDKQRLALKLTNCHLKDASRQAVICKSNKDIAQCLATIRDDSTFGVYTAFYIQVDNSCQYLQSDAWQQQTTTLIDHLTTIADRALIVQSEMIVQSTETLQHLKTAAVVSDDIVSNIQTMNLELRQHAQQSEQAHMTALQQSQEISETIRDVYSFVQNVNSVIQRLSTSWYVLWTLNISFVLTSTAYTQFLRISLMSVSVLSAVLEYFMYKELYSIRKYAVYLASVVCLLQCAVLMWRSRIFRAKHSIRAIQLNELNRKQLQIMAKKRNCCQYVKQKDCRFFEAGGTVNKF